MAKLRSPVLGFNHNVRYHGRIFHVQTEDSGPGNPHVFTHLFYEGTILSSRKTVYDAALPETDVKAQMQGQHKEMMKDLKRGACDDRIAAFFGARGEPAILLDAPEVAAPTVGPGAQSSRALDLDALPAAVPEPRLVLEDVAPVAVSEAAADAEAQALAMAASAVPTPIDRARHSSGAYVTRGVRADRPFDPGTPMPEIEYVDELPKPPGRGAPPAYEELVVADRTPPAEAAPKAVVPPVTARLPSPRPATQAPPPQASARPTPVAPSPHPVAAGRSATPPVIVLQPVRRPPSRNAPSAEGVVVQRQVVVAVGGAAKPAPNAPQPRTQRPGRVAPVIITPAARGAVPQSPARPRTPTPLPPDAPSAFAGDLDSDRSLDDVILAYLAEDSGGIPIK